MALHVDLIHTDWLAGTQRAVARVEIGGAGALEVSPSHWAKQLPALDAMGDPQSVLRELHNKLDGTHVEATEPHEDDACPFAGGGVVHLRGVSVDARVPATR